MTNQIKVGSKAPNFTLPDVDLRYRSLKEFLGQKVVLAFFVALSLLSALKKCVRSVIQCRV